ncbi:putative integration host factor subunit alpha [Fusobacterium gonidiaformans 3-1-5R]|uniref:Putative integration host factor subunit alpha n=1 Tax=Fusobacterium gonidiaformans 3-1-5R TaxID=469605 RepID=E5BEP9_9FUSO|nr:HU family DNA-binding protein [Fusobacterium gonidiaformans]EFS20580.1 putative integration host factor subunit alpha [Fusobacterium gonidiaformans 3-1-5R]
MTKKEFIELYFRKGKFSTKTEAEKAMTSFLETLEEVALLNENILFSGFGKFEVVEKAERLGRNPKTGEEVRIPAKKSMKFKPGKSLDEKLNN